MSLADASGFDFVLYEASTPNRLRKLASKRTSSHDESPGLAVASISKRRRRLATTNSSKTFEGRGIDIVANDADRTIQKHHMNHSGVMA